MIFAPDLAAKVLAGTKTQTRRPLNGEMGCRYVVSRTYAVQDGRGHPALGRIAILETEIVTPVDAISELDAIAEGFDSREAFLDRWVALYGTDALGWAAWKIRFCIPGPGDNDTQADEWL